MLLRRHRVKKEEKLVKSEEKKDKTVKNKKASNKE